MIITEKKFNNNLGFDPISLFVYLDETLDYPLRNLQDSFDVIDEQDIRDLIFRGSVIKHEKFLKWLTAQLIASDFFVSIILDMEELYKHGRKIDVFAQRIILIVDKLFPKWVSVLEVFGKDDIILFRSESPQTLFSVAESMFNHKCTSRLFVDTAMISSQDLLSFEELKTPAYPYKEN